MSSLRRRPFAGLVRAAPPASFEAVPSFFLLRRSGQRALSRPINKDTARSPMRLLETTP